jgi:replication factor A1
MSGYSIKCTFWGKQAESFDHHNCPVVAMKGVKVSDFSGRSLGVSDTTSIEVSPDLPEAHRLRGWYDTTGHASTFESYAKGGASGGNDTAVKTIGQIAEENMGMGEKVYHINSA